MEQKRQAFIAHVREVTMMRDYDFDFQVVERQIRSVYRKGMFSSWTVWTEDDYVRVFHDFYEAYKYYRGEAHPFLTNASIYKVMSALPECGGDDLHEFSLDPDDYAEFLIDAYFQTRFQRGCNYSILHFISGNIRALRCYETLY